MNQVEQLKRAIRVARMIEHAEGFLNTLARYMDGYNNPDPAYDKIRIMFDQTWLNRRINKYVRVKNRLEIWNKAILARLSRSACLTVPTQGTYCDPCSVEALIIKQTP